MLVMMTPMLHRIALFIVILGHLALCVPSPSSSERRSLSRQLRQHVLPDAEPDEDDDALGAPDQRLKLKSFFADHESPRLLSPSFLGLYTRVAGLDQPCDACESDAAELAGVFNGTGLGGEWTGNATEYCDGLRRERLLACTTLEEREERGTEVNETERGAELGYLLIVDQRAGCNATSEWTEFPSRILVLPHILGLIVRQCGALQGALTVPEAPESSKLRVVWLTDQLVHVDNNTDTLEVFGGYPRLRGLAFERTRIRAPLPSAIGNLTNLRFLVMRESSFYGTIPPSWRNMTSLMALDLGDNRLAGRVPEWFGEMPRLKWIDLDFNYFEGRAPPLPRTAELVELADNFFSSIPFSWRDLPNLVYMGLANNRLQSWPLWGASNRLTCRGVAPEVLSEEARGGVSVDWPSLNWLVVSHNNLNMSASTFLRSIAKAPNLAALVARNAGLYGRVGFEAWEMLEDDTDGCSTAQGFRQLVRLELSSNNITHLTGWPGTRTGGPPPPTLDIANNQLVEIAPKWFESLYVDVTGNKELQGPVMQLRENQNCEVFGDHWDGLGVERAGEGWVPMLYADADGFRVRSSMGWKAECTEACAPDRVVRLDPAYNATQLCRCRPGTYGLGDDCKLCPPGTYSHHDMPFGTTQCRACPAYSTTLDNLHHVDTSRLADIAEQRTAAGVGAGEGDDVDIYKDVALPDSVTACKCQPGYFFYFENATDGVCAACPKGTYNEGFGDSSIHDCLPCPASDMTTKHTATTSGRECYCRHEFTLRNLTYRSFDAVRCRECRELSGEVCDPSWAGPVLRWDGQVLVTDDTLDSWLWEDVVASAARALGVGVNRVLGTVHRSNWLETEFHHLHGGEGARGRRQLRRGVDGEHEYADGVGAVDDSYDDDYDDHHPLTALDVLRQHRHMGDGFRGEGESGSAVFFRFEANAKELDGSDLLTLFHELTHANESSTSGHEHERHSLYHPVVPAPYDRWTVRWHTNNGRNSRQQPTIANVLPPGGTLQSSSLYLTLGGLPEAAPGYYRLGHTLNIEKCRVSPRGCLGRNQCAAGLEGLYCGTCRPGYWSQDSAAFCHVCPSLANNLWMIGGCLLLFSFLIIIWAALQFRRGLAPFDVGTTALKILVNWSACVFPLSNVTPDEARLDGWVSSGLRAVSWGTVLPVSFLSVDCLAQSMTGNTLDKIFHWVTLGWFFSPFLIAFCVIFISFLICSIATLATRPSSPSRPASRPQTPSGTSHWLSIPRSLLKSLRRSTHHLHHHHKSTSPPDHEHHLPAYNTSSTVSENNSFKLSFKSHVNPSGAGGGGQRLLGIWRIYHLQPSLDVVDETSGVKETAVKGCGERLKDFLKDTTPVLIIALFLIYPIVVTQMLRPFNCRWLDVPYSPEGDAALASPFEVQSIRRELHLAAHLNAQCYKGVHASAAWIGGVGLLVWGVGTPLIAFILVGRQVDHLNNQDVRRPFGFLYKEYKPSRWYWETVIVVRKFCVLLVMAISPSADGVAPRLGFYALVAAFALTLHLYNKPYDSAKFERLHHVETFALFVWLMSVLMLSVVILAGPDEVFSRFLGFLIFAGCVGFIVYVLGIFLFSSETLRIWTRKLVSPLSSKKTKKSSNKETPHPLWTRLCGNEARQKKRSRAPRVNIDFIQRTFTVVQRRRDRDPANPDARSIWGWIRNFFLRHRRAANEERETGRSTAAVKVDGAQERRFFTLLLCEMLDYFVNTLLLESLPFDWMEFCFRQILVWKRTGQLESLGLKPLFRRGGSLHSRGGPSAVVVDTTDMADDGQMMTASRKTSLFYSRASGLTFKDPFDREEEERREDELEVMAMLTFRFPRSITDVLPAELRPPDAPQPQPQPPSPTPSDGPSRPPTPAPSPPELTPQPSLSFTPIPRRSMSALPAHPAHATPSNATTLAMVMEGDSVVPTEAKSVPGAAASGGAAGRGGPPLVMSPSQLESLGGDREGGRERGDGYAPTPTTPGGSAAFHLSVEEVYTGLYSMKRLPKHRMRRRLQMFGRLRGWEGWGEGEIPPLLMQSHQSLSAGTPGKGAEGVGRDAKDESA
ncbi:unnamed protein product [Vitrella brassicaformis CCMP3155]|uniref:Tyrosine-protein kinase ephrin type A/B receptor-like domain-containing protein n=3 Tax=Vitrella brassicaformis TaxID=1169539 RepID=A0A0G4EY19_VITBC|nr:unnamed protein product [Vitrella brassicaformis CCMP3155]|eukprot:CEM04227.1 unnamed protein product [Vitrella brassicaformis CCMP3155]